MRAQPGLGLSQDGEYLRPAVKLAEPVLPTSTLMPAGVEVMRSPLLPVTDTVNIAVPVGATGLRVTVAVLAAPP